jgi:hypothetical protein
MKQMIRKMGFTAVLALSTFSVSSMVHPQPAQAVIGSVAWPLFPLMIVGAALEGTSVITAIASWSESARGYHSSAMALGDSSVAQFVVGLIFLDASQGVGTVEKITPEKGKKWGLTNAEIQAYNQAVENGQMDQIFQQATRELRLNDSHDQAKIVMQNLLSALPDAAHTGFSKIAQHLVLSQSK